MLLLNKIYSILKVGKKLTNVKRSDTVMILLYSKLSINSLLFISLGSFYRNRKFRFDIREILMLVWSCLMQCNAMQFPPKSRTRSHVSMLPRSNAPLTPMRSHPFSFTRTLTARNSWCELLMRYRYKSTGDQSSTGETPILPALALGFRKHAVYTLLSFWCNLQVCVGSFR